jgi:hypothetical protein
MVRKEKHMTYQVLVVEVERYTKAIVTKGIVTGSLSKLPISNSDKIKLADFLFGQCNGKLPRKFTFKPTDNKQMTLTFIR